MKAFVRQAVFPLIVNEERKIRTAASVVICTIASTDWPEDWPSLIDDLIRITRQGSDLEIQGALRVLKGAKSTITH